MFQSLVIIASFEFGNFVSCLNIQTEYTFFCCMNITYSYVTFIFLSCAKIECCETAAVCDMQFFVNSSHCWHTGAKIRLNIQLPHHFISFIFIYIIESAVCSKELTYSLAKGPFFIDSDLLSLRHWQDPYIKWIKLRRLVGDSVYAGKEECSRGSWEPCWFTYLGFPNSGP